MIEVASRKFRDIAILLIWISSVVASSVVTAAAEPATPQSLIGAYVAELTASDPSPDNIKAVTTDDYRLVVLDEDVGPALARLRSIGKVVDIQIIATEQFSAFTAYKAAVRHASGASMWQFKVQDQKIALATLLQLADGQPAVGAAAGPKAAPIASPHAEEEPATNRRGKRSARRAKTPEVSATPEAPTTPDVSSAVEDASVIVKPSAPQPCSSIAAICNAASSDRDPRVIDFLFVTDRKPTSQPGEVPTFGSERNESNDTGAPILTYGGASVRIPEDHHIGRIELPSSWQLFGWQLKWEKQDEQKHLIVKRLSTVAAADWGQLVKDQGSKTALVFVHGFNTSFEAAILRNAQIAWDLQFKGVSVLFSWSSKGQVADYLYDKDSALFARQSFLQVITRLRDELGIETINVIAHSMGNLVVVDALRESAGSLKPVSINELVMASPDVARDMYIAALPDLAKVTKGMTLYASGADKALKISGDLAAFPRAGGIGPTGPVVFPSLETIDVTAIGDELLGLNHTEFATNRAVMDDLKILLDQQRPAPRLGEIRQFPEPPKPVAYWKYAP